MIETMRVAAGTATAALTAQNVFPLPVLDAAILSSRVGRCRAMSSVSYLSRAWSKMWGYSRWNRFASSFRLKVISTSGFHFLFRGRHLSFGCRLMSHNVGSVIFGSGAVANVGVAAGIASPALSVQKLFPLPVSTSGFVADI